MTPAVFHVLLCLDREPRHGYGIMQETAATSGLTMGPGTVYGTLQRLEDAGQVEESPGPEEAGGERRKYWRITAAGRTALREEAERLAGLAELVRARNLVPRRGV